MAKKSPPAKADDVKPLSSIEAVFLDHYLACNFNASEAARRLGIRGAEAGKDRTNPATRGYGILQRPHVQVHLARRRAEIAEQFPQLLERALRTYHDILDLDRRELFDERGALKPIHELTFEQASCIRKVRTRRVVEGPRDSPEVVEYMEIEFESKKTAADAVIDRMRPDGGVGPAAPEGGGGGPSTPAVVNVIVLGERIPQPTTIIENGEG